MKKGLLMVPIWMSLGLLLTGCGNSNKESASSSKEAKTTEVASKKAQANSSTNHEAKTSSQNEKNEEAALWNDEKNQKLATFMQQWGKSMNQTYESFGPNRNTNFYGLKFPAQLDQTLLKVNQQEVSMKWSANGTGDADYNIVAIYSDSQSASPMSAHLYFFTFHNGKPIVLVTSQTNGNVTKSTSNNKDDGLFFKETENKDLKNGFADIVAGKTPTISNSSNADNSSVSQSSTQTGQKNAADNFPENMQGEWFAYSPYEDKIITLTIKDNKITSEGTTTEVHKITEAEKKANQSINADQMNDQQRNWAYFNHIDGWLNVYGWYQSAGNGTYYKVVNEQINSQATPVLEQASGATINVNYKFYRSKELAMQQKNSSSSSTPADMQTVNDD